MRDVGTVAKHPQYVANTIIIGVYNAWFLSLINGSYIAIPPQ